MNRTVTRTLDARTASSRPRFDEQGYLVDADAWSPTLAQQLAAAEGIERLRADHWKLIEHVRAKYFALGALPVMRLVCRAAGIEPGAAGSLFRGCASLWRIAGLPNPGEEALAYMH